MVRSEAMLIDECDDAWSRTDARIPQARIQSNPIQERSVLPTGTYVAADRASSDTRYIDTVRVNRIPVSWTWQFRPKLGIARLMQLVLQQSSTMRYGQARSG